LTLSIDEIKEILPHRYPFLLVDKVLEIEEKRIVAVKNVTINEPFFQGHFPQKPVMPGVLIAESLAQTGAILLLNKPEFKGKLALFTGIDDFKFRRQVEPGDTLRLEVELLSFKLKLGKADAKAYVGEELAAGGTISFAVA
jgi:3-hydroxyacyl-[acyl-carrier-protein] dehydratase